jgi:hypothetical protein
MERSGIRLSLHAFVMCHRQQTDPGCSVRSSLHSVAEVPVGARSLPVMILRHSCAPHEHSMRSAGSPSIIA